MVSWAAHDQLHLRQLAKRLFELARRDGSGYSVAYAGAWQSRWLGASSTGWASLVFFRVEPAMLPWPLAGSGAVWRREAVAVSGHSIKTRVLWAALGVLTLAAGMALLSVLFQGSVGIGEQMLMMSITTVIYALLALVAGLVIAKRPRIGWWSLGLLAMSFASWIVFIWAEPGWQEQEIYMRVIGFLVVPAGVSLHLGVLMLPSVRATHWRILRIIAGGCSVVGGLLMLLMFASDDAGYLWDDGGPIIGVLILLALFGTVMVPVASSIERSAATDEHEIDIDQRTPVVVTCPRCLEQSSIRSNTDGVCESCGLRIRVNIKEPRCACGYLLYNLTGEVCPECGKPIDEQARWHRRGDAS